MAAFTGSPLDEAGDNIFLYSGSYTTGLTLLANQRLIGQGATQSLQTITGLTPPAGSLALPATGGTRPTISVSSGTGVTLASGNNVQGLNVSNSNGSGITGSVVGTTPGLTLADFDVTVTGGTALSLTTSGTVTATGTDNDLSATTGAALNVNAVTIGAAGLTFKSISASGAAKGISLVNTGAGGLTITGTGTTDGTGGTIQNITQRGIELISASNVSLKNMALNNANTTDSATALVDLSSAAGLINAEQANAAILLNGVSTLTLDNIDISGTAQMGIAGRTVSNFTLKNSSIINAGDGSFGASAHVESGVWLYNVSGTSLIDNTEISFSQVKTVNIVNRDTSLSLTLNNSIFRDTQTHSSGGAVNTDGEDGFLFQSFSDAAGAPTVNIDIINSQFLRIRTQSIQVFSSDDSIVNLDITGNTIDSGADIGTGLDLNANNSAQMNFNVIGNPTIQSRGGAAVNITSFLDSTMKGRVNDNPDIEVLGGAGIALRFVAQENSDMIVEARRNTLSNVNGTEDTVIDAQARFQTARIDLTLDDNTSTVEATGIADINLIAGSSTANEMNEVHVDLISNNASSNGAARALRLRVSDLDATSNPQMFLKDFVEAGTSLQDAEATWNAKGNTPSSSGGNNVAVSLSGTATAPSGGTVLVPNNPLPLRFAPGGVKAKSDELPTAPDFAFANDASLRGSVLERMSETAGGTPALPAEIVRTLTQSELDSLVASALARWTEAGLTGDQLAALGNLKFEVADLPGWYLGEAGGDRIRVDNNAGGNGWFISSAGQDDAQFAKEISATRRYTDPASAPAGRIDLLTAILHEMGHALGLGDTYAEQDRDSLMYGFLTKGERRLPAQGQAAGAKPHAEAHTHFLGTPLTIGDLPPGKTVTITYVVQINAGTTAISTSSQGTVSGGGFTTLVTNDPQTGTPNDATVTPIHQPPVVSNVSKSVNEDVVTAFATADFTPGSYSDPNGDALAIVRITSLPSNGVLKNGLVTIATVPTDFAIGSIANLNYTPNANYNGADSFGWNGSDGTLFAVSGALVNITVNAVNDKPTFTAADPPAVDEDAGAQTVAGWVTNFNPGPANESGQTVLGYTVSAVSNGGLFSAPPTVANNGTLSYTPAGNANGTSTFQVTVQDSGGTALGGIDTSDAQTFTITVNAVNDKPTFTAANPPTVIQGAGAQTVVGWVTSFNPGPANESGQTVVAYTVSAVSNPGLFSAPPTVANNGTLSYTPAANANGTSTFQVTVQDSGGTTFGGIDTSDPQTFTITVLGLDFGDAPTSVQSGFAASNPTLLADLGARHVIPSGPVTLYLGAVAPDADADGQPSADAGAAATSGDDNVSGTDDEEGVSLPANFERNIATTLSVTITGAGGILNAWIDWNRDGDWDDAGEKIANDQAMAAGITILNVTPPSATVGGTSFARFRLSTDSGLTPTGQASDGEVEDYSVTLVANSAPVAVLNNYTVAEGGTLGATDADGTATPADTTDNGVLVNDTDANGDALTAVIVTQPTRHVGVFTLNANGTFTYQHNGSETTSDSFTYKANDGTTDGNIVTVSITVTPLNDNPVANTDSLARQTNAPAKLAVSQVLANDTDAELDTLTVTGVNSPTGNGTTVTLDGIWLIYEPPNGFNAADSFTYNISDGNGGTATGTVNVTVAPNGNGQTKNIISITPSGADMIVRFAGIAGRSYRIETTADLTPTITWTPHPAGTQTAGANGIVQLTDLAPPSPRFYRAVED